MNITLIITLPEHDLITKYITVWSNQILDSAKKSGAKIIELRREKAIKKELLGRIKKLQPELVVLNGHGNEVCIAGHDNTPLLRVGEKIFPIQIIYARACKAAKILGEELVKNGVGAFIGYKEDFVLRIDKNEVQKILDNKVAELYMIPSNQVSVALLKGATAYEANQRSVEYYKKTIQSLLLEGSKSEFYQELPFLYWNMSHQVCLGNPDTKL